MVVHSSNYHINAIENMVRCKRNKERKTVAWNTEHSECQMLMKRVNRGQGTSSKIEPVLLIAASLFCQTSFGLNTEEVDIFSES